MEQGTSIIKSKTKFLNKEYEDQTIKFIQNLKYDLGITDEITIEELKITEEEHIGMKGKIEKLTAGCKITLKVGQNYPSFDHSIALDYTELEKGMEGDELNKERIELVDHVVGTTLYGLSEAITKANIKG